MTSPLRIAIVAPVATSVPPARSGSIESATSLLTEGLVRRGHDVTLFATGSSVTSARLVATFPNGYRDDASLWPWELCELFNLSAAVERSADFDVIHYQSEYYPMSLAYSRLASVPLVQTVHHAPDPSEVALWSRYADAPFIAISREQARLLSGLSVVATIPHAVDLARFPFTESPEDYLVFLGRFTEGKGVLLDQFANPDNPVAHYETTGPEIWRDPEGSVTHFVSSMGTTGTIMGPSRFLKEKNPKVQIVGCQPEEGSQIPGIRKWPEAYLPRIYDKSRVDRLEYVHQRDAEEMARRLAKEEGIFAGISSGGAVAVALRIAREAKNAVIVTIICDRGDRYLSSGVFPQ